MENLLLKFLILALSIYIVGKVTRLFYVADFFTAFLAAIFLAIINTIIRPILIILTLPFTILTFGIFLIFINGFSLLLVSSLIPKFKVDGCFVGGIAAMLISLVNMLLEFFLI